MYVCAQPTGCRVAARLDLGVRIKREKVPVSSAAGWERRAPLHRLRSATQSVRW